MGTEAVRSCLIEHVANVAVRAMWHLRAKFMAERLNRMARSPRYRPMAPMARHGLRGDRACQVKGSMHCDKPFEPNRVALVFRHTRSCGAIHELAPRILSSFGQELLPEGGASGNSPCRTYLQDAQRQRASSRRATRQYPPTELGLPRNAPCLPSRCLARAGCACTKPSLTLKLANGLMLCQRWLRPRDSGSTTPASLPEPSLHSEP